MNYLKSLFCPTPAQLRAHQLIKLRIQLVDAELTHDKNTADLSYLNAAIARLSSNVSDQ
jgi:hypothetical protein